MADTIGIVTSALHAARRVYETLKTINDAPEEIRTLQLQASIMQSFLPNVLDMVEHDQQREALSDPRQLEILLEQAQQFQDAAERFLTKVAKKKSTDIRARVKYTLYASGGWELQEKFKSLLITLIAVTTSRTARVLALVPPQLSNNSPASPDTSLLGEPSTASVRDDSVLVRSTVEPRWDSVTLSGSQVSVSSSFKEENTSSSRTTAHYVVAFHVKRRVRMLGFADWWQAESMYNWIPDEWAKVLMRIPDNQVLKSHADHLRWITICETVVRSATNTEVSYTVAFHERGRVKILGCVNLEDAGIVYNLIPEQWAKVLMKMPENQVMDSHGNDYWVQVCETEVRSVPLAEVHCMVGFYVGDRVVLLGSAKEEDAEAAYHLISTNPAKVLMKLPENHVLMAHGVDESIELCETTMRSAPLSTASIHPPPSSVAIYYVVAFHERGRFRMVGSANRGDAEALYHHIPGKIAKVLAEMPHHRVLVAEGGDRWVEGCEAVVRSSPFAEVRRMLAFQEAGAIRILGSANQEDAEVAYNHIPLGCPKIIVKIPENQVLRLQGDAHGIRACEAGVLSISLVATGLAPLDACHYLVTFHQRGHIRILGSTNREDAEAAYRQISKQWCKVLMKIPDTQVLKSHGEAQWTGICEAAMRSIAMTASRVPLSEVTRFLIAFHERDRVRILDCTTREDAEAVYAQVSEQWSKVLMKMPGNQTLKSHGRLTWVKLCEAELRASASSASIYKPR